MIRQWQGDKGTAGLGTLFRLLIAEAQTDETVRAAMQAERESRWLHIDRIVTQARDRGELNPAISVIAAERRIISVMWYLLLTDALPPPEATPALVADLMAGLTAV